jgi:thioredoxin 1
MAVNVDDNNYKKEVEESDIPCILDFWAEWCMPCKMFTPIFEEVSKSFEGRVKFVKIDTEKAPNTSRNFDIMSIPCIIFVKNGKEVHRNVGMQTKDNLKKLVELHLLK